MSVLTEKEQKLLVAFQRRVGDLERAGLVTQRVERTTLHLLGEQQGLVGLDLDHLRSFATTLRQFTVDGDDDVNFGRVCNLVAKACDSARLRGWTAHYRQAWNRAWRAPLGVAVSIRGEEPRNYTTKEFFDLWLYSGVFHSNPDKEREIDGMPHLAPELLLMILHSRLPGLFEILRLQATVIRYWQGGDESGVPEPPAFHR